VTRAGLSDLVFALDEARRKAEAAAKASEKPFRMSMKYIAEKLTKAPLEAEDELGSAMR
jgi:hypothetical protein